MATVHPFRALRYGPDTDLTQTVAPPYDIIGPAAQQELHERDPHNVIRLELGYERPDDTATANRYTRAAETLAAWERAGVLQSEDRPALYLYEEDFDLAGQRLRRTSLFALVSVTPYGVGRVLPHEQTLAKPLEDRYQLMLACRANLSPIFGLYADPADDVMGWLRDATGGSAPDMAFGDDIGGAHRVWAVTDPAAVARVTEFMAPRSIYIADGHHRYETALRFSREHPTLPGSDRVLMVLCSFSDPGLALLPTHRMVGNLDALDLPALLADLESDFTVTAYTGAGTGAQWAEGLVNAAAAAEEMGSSMGLCAGDKGYVLTLKNPSAVKSAAPDRSAAWQQLDVAVLQTLILDRRLGIGGGAARAQRNLTYTRDPGEAVAQVHSGTAQLAFLMPPMSVEAMRAVADAGDHMPQKSTYFYPKYMTGVVIAKQGQ